MADAARVTATNAKEVLFHGEVIQYDERKGFGWIKCDLVTELFDGDTYAFKSVLDFAGCHVGDGIVFGIHLNNNGKPQASLPCFKIGTDGEAIGIEEEAKKLGEGKEFMFAAEELQWEPQFLEQYQDAISKKSRQQNAKNKREATGPYGSTKGSGKASSNGAMRGYGGHGGPAGFGGPAPGPHGGIDIKVDGIPGNVEHREISHIFRQYAGFMSLRTANKGTHTLVFATFETNEQARFVMDALNGYIFDDQLPQWEQTQLSIAYSTGSKGGAKGKR